MRYFLTGATGFVGSHVVRQLLEAGHTVVAVVREPAHASDLARLGVQLYAGDVTDKESMRAAMTGADGVFHIASWYKIGVKDKRDGARVNIDGTRNTLELMRELGIAKGVYTSTLAVNSDTHGQLVDESFHYTGPHISEYDRTKYVAHFEVARPLMAAGLPLVIAMPGLVYGPGDTSAIGTLLRQYLRRKLTLIPKRAAYCWGYVDDIAHGHVLAMERGVPGQTYIIAGPPSTVVAALDLAQHITGIPAPPLRIAPSVLKAAAAVMRVLERVVPLPADLSAEYLRVSAGVTYLGNNARAKRELGFSPRSLREGLEETLRYEMRVLGLA
jgi:nucleoside-diphosphate-sugar epimerase